MNDKIKLSSVLTNYFIYYAPFIGMALIGIGVLINDLIMIAILVPVTIILLILSFFVVEAEIDIDYLHLERWNKKINVNLLNITKIGQYNLGIIGLTVTEVKFLENGKSRIVLILSSSSTLTFNEIDNVDEIILKRKLDKVRRERQNNDLTTTKS